MSKHDSTGAMAAAFFGTPGTEKAVEAVFGDDRPGGKRDKHAAVLKKFANNGMYFDSIEIGSGIPNTRGGTVLIEGDCGIEELEAFLYFLKRDQKSKATKSAESPGASVKVPETPVWFARSTAEVTRIVNAEVVRLVNLGRKVTYTVCIDMVPGYIKSRVTREDNECITIHFETAFDAKPASFEEINQTRLRNKS